MTNSNGRRSDTNWKRGSETAIGIRIALRWTACLLSLVGGVLQVSEGLDGRGLLMGIFFVLAVSWMVSAAPATQRWLQRRRHRTYDS